jgi:hypothetical protein
MPSIQQFDRFAFVVGAPRCGTTAIARFLAKHPEIAFSAVKEPHFFSQHDLRGLPAKELEQIVQDEYLERFFAGRGEGSRIGGDGSVSYLYTPEQMEAILRLWPESRFIVAVRDPLAMLPSLHQRLIYIGDETLCEFQDAWAATPERAAGRKIPRSCVDPRWLRYDEAGRLATYVERLFATVGRERCQVVVFDDLVTDPAGQGNRILDFLGLEAFDSVELKPARSSSGVRSPWLQRLLKRPPKPLRTLFAGKHYMRRVAEPAKAAKSDGAAVEAVMTVRKRLIKWNRIPAADIPVPLHVQQDIRARLRGEVDRLGELIGRDLSHWLQPSAGKSKLASPYE